ncbi:MAG TPA: BTAD domain-containing putative transcriptional regulator [Nocardioides sp.]|nr:BTAD domain-containing putative transcriptional regulator [Nocardioides sp.]
MQVRVLGDVEVEVAGELADLGGPKPRALLALLVAAAGRPVHVELLIDQMWGEDPPARVEASLQSYVARLRRSLEPDRPPGAAATRLRTHAAGYSLSVDEHGVDASRFTSLLREARPADDERATDLLTDALGLWRGDAYAGVDTPSVRAEATRLEELRAGALARLWELRLGRGEHDLAVPELERLVGSNPLQERLWWLLALALYRSHRQGDALATLRRAREHLAEELGVDPGPELRRLEELVLRQDPQLDAPQVADPVAPAVAAPVVEPALAAAGDDPLLGRDDALAAIAPALSGAAAGRGRVVVVGGEPGIGKTRLAEAVAELAAARGFRVGRGRWDAEGSPPLHAWSRALGQVLGAEPVRDVLGPATGAADGPGDAASVSLRQADEVLDALDGGAPVLLVLDDLHWADAESLRLLRRVAGGLQEVPVVLVVTTRVAPADVGEALAEALGVLARLDPVRVDLGGLGADAVAAWASRRSGRHVTDDVAALLRDRTDGNPFYLTELVRFLVSEGALGDTGAPAWRAVPGGVRDVVRQRSRQLPASAVDVLGAAAVTGRSFDVAVLDLLTGDPASVADAIEGAQVLGLVDEEGPGRYRFTHALVRDALDEALPAPVRARLHAQVAAALERVWAGRVGEVAADLAEHYRLAGPAHARSGWVLARRAAAEAVKASAFDEALRMTTLAIELQAMDPTAEAVEREDVLVAHSRALVRTSRAAHSWPPVEQAARHALDRGDPRAAADALLSVTEGVVWGWRVAPEYDDDAIALWRTVRDLLPADDVLTRAHLTAALAAEHLHKPGAVDESTRLADEAIAAVRRSGHRGQRELTVLRLAHRALLRPELLHHRMPLSDEIVELAATVGQPLDHAVALSSRAQDRAELRRLDDARSDVVRAHEIAERHHLSTNLMVTGWCLALRAQLDGRLDDAERMIEEGEALQATIAESGNGIGLCQLWQLRDLQGRLAELEPMLRGLRGFHPALREGHALALARTGRLDELRTLLGSWGEQPELVRDYLWLYLVPLRAEVWALLGDRDAARDLHDALVPYADRLAVAVPVGFHGSMRLTLGRLAAVLGDTDAARAHLLEARRVHDELGLPAWVARTEAELARL